MSAISFAVAPFDLLFPGQATDIDFDPLTGTLWLSHLNGFVTNELVGGGLGPGGVVLPHGFPCLSGTAQDGIAVDSATCKALFVHVGGVILHMDFFGAPAAPTFHAPLACFPWAGSGRTSGLAFDDSSTSYSKGCDPMGVVPPTAGSIGEAVSPNADFFLTVTGACEPRRQAQGCRGDPGGAGVQWDHGVLAVDHQEPAERSVADHPGPGGDRGRSVRGAGCLTGC